METVTTIEALAERVAQGERLRDDEAAFLAGSYDLIAIGTMADDVRRQLHGVRTTFVRVFDVHQDAVPESLPPGMAAGELRIAGRVHSADAACAAVRAARRLAGNVPLTGFTLDDLAAADDAAPGLFSRLKEAGLESVAEAPLDRFSAGDVERARAAGLVVARLTVHAPQGDAVALAGLARRAQADAGGFRVFAPLPRTIPPAAPTTGYDDVKLVALSRLLVREIPSIQVDWPLYGPKLAQVALTVGADDIDGVAAVESGALGTRRSALEEVRGNIRAAGLEAVERNGRFEVQAR